MATLDGYAPYSTGMTGKQAVEALWRAYKMGNNFCKIITSPTPPGITEIENDCSFWYDSVNDKLYRAWVSWNMSMLYWFEV